MPIIGNLPFTILDGQPVEAPPVMADFNYIVSQVNANVPALVPATSGVIPFLPAIAFGGASVGVTYTQVGGTYFTIGNAVFVSILIILSAKGSSTGTATITNLPFPVGASGGGSATLLVSNVTFAGKYLSAVFNASTSNVSMWQITSGSPAALLDDTAFANTSAVTLEGFYTV